MKRYPLLFSIVLLAALSLFFCDKLHAELSFRHSEDFESVRANGSYEGSALPEEGGKWILTPPSDATVADGVLAWRTTPRWQATWWDGRLAKQTGFTLELRAKVGSGAALEINIGGGVLIISEQAITWEGKAIAGSFNNGDRFHTYRIALLPRGLGYDLWRDGESLAEQAKGSDKDGLLFKSRQPGPVWVDYLRWDPTGAYCP